MWGEAVWAMMTSAGLSLPELRGLWLQLSLVVYEHLHLVDEVPGNSQDLLGIMAFSPLWG